MEKPIIIVVVLFLATMLSTALVGLLQPLHEKNCQTTTVLALEANNYTVALENTTDEAKVINVEAERYYTLNVGDLVEVCEIRGEWVPTLEGYEVRHAQ